MMRVPTVRLSPVPASGEEVKIDLVDSSMRVLTHLLLNSEEVKSMTLASFRSQLGSIGVSMIPQSFQFQVGGSLLEQGGDEEKHVLNDAIFLPPRGIAAAAAVSSSSSDVPRIALFPLGWGDDAQPSAHETDCFGRTQLHYAVIEGNAELVKQLLSESASIRREDHRGQTALHLAASATSVEVLEVVFDKTKQQGETFAKAFIEQRDQAGRTALLLALLNRRIPCARRLLSWGAETNVTDKHGACGDDLIRKLNLDLASAVRSDDIELVRLHIGRLGSLTPQPQPPLMQHPLHDAAELNKVHALELMIKTAGWYHSPVDSSNQTPLHRAATNGHVEACRVLLAAGASPFSVDSHGQNAIHRVCAHRGPATAGDDSHLATLNALLEAAALTASPFKRDDALLATDRDNRTPLHVAAGAGWVDAITAILTTPSEVVDADTTKAKYRKPPASSSSSAANVTAPEYPTPLVIAYIAGKSAVVEMLIAFGASLRSVKLLKVAVQRRDADLVEKIIACWPAACIQELITGNEMLLHDSIACPRIALSLAQAGWDPLFENPATKTIAFKDLVAANRAEVVSVLAPRTPIEVVSSAIKAACEHDADLSLEALLSFLSDAIHARVAVYAAAATGSYTCIKLAIDFCRRLNTSWHAGCSGEWMYANIPSCCSRRCSFYSPLLLCLHSSSSAAATRFDATATEIMAEAEADGFLLPLIRASCSAGSNAILLAANQGRWPLVCNLARADPSSLHVPQLHTQNTPLHIAIMAGSCADTAVATMIECGAPLLARNQAGFTPLQVARTRHNANAKTMLRTALQALRTDLDNDFPPETHAQHKLGPTATTPARPSTAPSVAAASAIAENFIRSPTGTGVTVIDWDETGDEAEIVTEEDGLAPCGYCGRRFVPERLVPHRKACKKASRPKSAAPASAEEVVKTRTAGNGNLIQCESCFRKYFPHAFAHHLASCKPRPPPTAHVVGDEHLRAVEPETVPAQATIVLEDGRVQCQNCGRGFNPERIQRHVEVCAKACNARK